jgi:hypothetical protein
MSIPLTDTSSECFADPPKAKTIEKLLRNLAWVNDTALGGAYIVNCDIHAVDVALWIAGDVPVSAVGYSSRNRPHAQNDSHDCYAVSFPFKDGYAGGESPDLYAEGMHRNVDTFHQSIVGSLALPGKISFESFPTSSPTDERA